MTGASPVATSAWAPLPRWGVFACEGRDAVDLLGRLSSNDLAPLSGGRAVTTLFLTPTGRVRHRVLLVPPVGDAPLRAVLEDGAGFPEWVDTYTFAEDCRVRPLPGDLVHAAFGEPVTALLDANGAVAIQGHATWVRRDWGPLPAAMVLGDAALAGSPLDAQALLQLRVETGEPAAGSELTEDRFPLEAGLIAEVSFTKGCYTGQEVVARQDTYGKVARRLVGLRSASPLRPGEELPSEGRGCAITSVAPEPAGGETAALAYVASRSAVEGAVVRTASDAEARVVLPR